MQSHRQDLTAEYVRELLDYDPETGELRWKKTKSGRSNGPVAGTLGEWGRNGKQRRTITIDYVIYKSHRVIWLWMTGAWPKDQIDHINRDAADNRWKNLREGTPLINRANSSVSRNNTSGTTGVYWDKRCERWKVAFDRKHYGYFDNKDDAVYAALRIEGSARRRER